MRIRPVGNGMIGEPIGLSIHPGHVKAVTERVQSHHTVPHGTDAICAFPRRNFAPGYLHFVPSGLNPTLRGTCRIAPDFTLLSAIHHYPCKAVAQRQPCNCSPYPLRFEFVAAQPPDD
jgi:hypothetical protein